MRSTYILIFSVVLLVLGSCGTRRLDPKDSEQSPHEATISIEHSPTTTLEEVIINREPMYPDTRVRVPAGDQEVSFRFSYEDKENPTLSPPFRGSCRGSFYARPQRSYTITSAGVWQNEELESRFWVVEPTRESVATFDCTKIGLPTDAKFAEKELPKTEQKGRGFWDTVFNR